MGKKRKEESSVKLAEWRMTDQQCNCPKASKSSHFLQSPIDSQSGKPYLTWRAHVTDPAHPVGQYLTRFLLLVIFRNAKDSHFFDFVFSFLYLKLTHCLTLSNLYCSITPHSAKLLFVTLKFHPVLGLLFYSLHLPIFKLKCILFVCLVVIVFFDYKV